MVKTASARLSVILTVPFLVFNLAYPSTGGKISGTVTNAETGTPLPGANVVLEGTYLGAAADEHGDYFILNVPPGTYSITAQVIGFVSTRVVDVLVQSSITTDLDIALAPTILEGQTVVVEWDRPEVELGVGNSTNILTGEALNDMPVLQFKDILSRQAGMEVLDARGLVVRGGREHEISLTLDGMETRDLIDNAVYTRLNPDAVQEVEIQTGGFSARYGNARSGIINVTTKEGGDKYSFTMDVRASNPAPKHFGDRWYERERDWKLSDESILNPYRTDTLITWTNERDPVTREYGYYETQLPRTIYQSWETIANDVDSTDAVYGGFYGRPYLCQELYRWRTRPEVSEYGDKPDLNANFTFGGPIPLLPRTYFFASGRFERNYYLIKAPQDYFQDWSGSLKATSHLTRNLKLTITGNYATTSGVNRTDAAIGSRDSGINGLEDFNPTKNESRTIIESPETFAWFIQTRTSDGHDEELWPYSEFSVSTRVRQQLGARLTHQLSGKTYWDVAVDYNRYDITGRYDTIKRDTTATVTLVDPSDAEYSVTLSGPYAMAPKGYYRDDELWSETEEITGVKLSGSYHNREDSWAESIRLNANLISQMTKHHQITAGVDFVTMHIVKDEYRNHDIAERHWWQWDISAQQGAAYFEDKLEYGGMVATVGLRTDFSFPDEWFDVENYPFQAYLSQDWVQLSEGRDSREFTVDPGDSRIQPILRKPGMKVKYAPRFAVSHPIGAKAKIYFNYGHFYQLPDPEKMYYQVRRENTRNGSIYRLGNPFIDYEKTVQYEVGFSQSFLDRFSVDITSYYRNVSDLARAFTYSGDGNYSYTILPGIEAGTLDTVEYSLVTYDTWDNIGFEDIRGFEARVAKRAGQFFTWSVNGSIAIYSVGEYGYSTVRQDTADDPSLNLTPLTKPATRPKLNVNLNFHTPSNFGPAFLGQYPVADLHLNLLFWWRSQPKQNYNSRTVTTQYMAIQNTQWRPHHATDLRLTKRFKPILGHVRPVFYIMVSNLFNTRNMFRGAFMGQYGMGANPNFTGEIKDYMDSLKYDEGDQPGDYEEDYIKLPPVEPFYMFLNPRQIFFGLRLEM
jgi:outer membrane receptor for ferrienterochelin and colicin